jgi:hypothetical protein
MQIKTIMIDPHLLEWLLLEKKPNKYWQGRGEKESLCTIGGNAN